MRSWSSSPGNHLLWLSSNLDPKQLSKLIVDRDDNEGNDCEQSDMVAILVNLAYVRQNVAGNFRFAPGYSESFVAGMKQ